MRTLPILLICLAFPSASISAAEPTPAPLARNSKGFIAPKLDGYTKRGTSQADTTLAIEGQDTTVETWQNEAGDRILKLETNGVLWAYGIIPAGDAEKGWLLRDPACSKRLTEKWAATTPFSAPDCAVKKKKPK